MQKLKEVKLAKEVDGHVGTSSKGSRMQVGSRFKEWEYNIYNRKRLGQKELGKHFWAQNIWTQLLWKILKPKFY